MTAKQAREKALQIRKEKANAGMDAVMKSIETAINSGETSCYHYKALGSETIAELKRQGYKVEGGSDRDGMCYEIGF